MVKKLSFAGGCLWCYQQHKCTAQYASEVGRRKMQGMCPSLSSNYMYLEPMQAKPDTSFSFGTCVYVCQCYNCEMPSWVSCWNQFICIHHLKLTLDFWTVIVVGHPSSSFRLWQPPFSCILCCAIFCRWFSWRPFAMIDQWLILIFGWRSSRVLTMLICKFPLDLPLLNGVINADLL